jgi:hypothetical protein
MELLEEWFRIPNLFWQTTMNPRKLVLVQFLEELFGRTLLGVWCNNVRLISEVLIQNQGVPLNFQMIRENGYFGVDSKLL